MSAASVVLSSARLEVKVCDIDKGRSFSCIVLNLAVFHKPLIVTVY